MLGIISFSLCLLTHKISVSTITIGTVALNVAVMTMLYKLIHKVASLMPSRYRQLNFVTKLCKFYWILCHEISVLPRNLRRDVL